MNKLGLTVLPTMATWLPNMVTLRIKFMGRRHFGQIDLNTGEIIENGFIAYVSPKRKNGFGKRWVAMSQDALNLLAESNLDGTSFKVLMKLIAMLDFENLLVLNQAEIARELKMQRSHVNRAIKRLLSINILFEGPRIGVSRSYRLNPHFGWKGSAKNHVIALDEALKKRGMSVVEGGKKD